MADIQFQGVSY